MKLHNRTAIFATFFAVLFVLLGTFSAQASGFYYRWATPLPTVTCDLSGGLANITTTGRSVEWNLPAGASTDIYDYLNGDLTFAGNFPQPSGTGSHVFGGFGNSQPSFPFSSGARMDTVINGQVVYHSTIIFSCASNGATGVATIINEGVGGGSSAISDGRINPENYAPVALYCNGSVLTAYVIDTTGQGTVAWTFDLKNDSTDRPLISQMGIALSKTADGRYDVLAPQHDGKQYLFVFNACPSPGATEVYISDPATGQFVRTE